MHHHHRLIFINFLLTANTASVIKNLLSPSYIMLFSYLINYKKIIITKKNGGWFDDEPYYFIIIQATTLDLSVLREW